MRGLHVTRVTIDIQFHATPGVFAFDGVIFLRAREWNWQAAGSCSRYEGDLMKKGCTRPGRPYSTSGKVIGAECNMGNERLRNGTD